MKKHILTLFAIFYAATAFAFDFSATAPNGQTLYFQITSGSTVSVTYPRIHSNNYYDGYTKPSGALTIPDSVSRNGIWYIVTSIGAYAFYECSGLTSVTLPNSLTSIGSYAFYGCRGLTSVTLPNSLTHIATYAFASCSGLTSVTLPNSLTDIATYAFAYCSGLTSVTLPNSLTSIGSRAFYYCSGLTSVTLPNSLTSIGESAFEGCSGLTSVTLPNSLTSIGSRAFYYCSGLTSVTLPNSLTSIGSRAFYSCSGLERLVISDGANIAIPSECFSGCSGLKYVYVGASVRSIYKNITSESDDAFYAVSHLDTLVYNARNCTNTYSRALFPTSISTLILGDSVRSIPQYAFYNCSGLTGELTLPNSLTSIGSYAFYNCSGLTGELTLPNSLTSIGSNAFHNCGVERLVISDGARIFLQDDAFGHCSNLRYCYIGSNVRSIFVNKNPYSSSFINCTHLDTVVYNANIGSFEVSAFRYRDNNYKDKEIILIIGDSVKNIPDYFYRFCPGMKELHLSSSIERIGEYAFSEGGNSGITKTCILPTFDSLKSVGNHAFYNCSGLTGGLIFSDSLTTIGDEAFYGCSGLNANLALGNSVSHIGKSAFYNCNGLTGNLTFSDSLTTIGKEAFYGCSGLTGTVRIPNTLTQIDTAVFYGCSQLDTIILGDEVHTISANAFYGCVQANLSLKINSPDFKIEMGALNGCGFIDTLIIADNSITEVPSGCFSNTSIGYCSIGNTITTSQNGPFGESYIRKLDFKGTLDNCPTNRLFAGCTLDTLILNDQIQTIPYSAFFSCRINNLHLPNTLVSIEDFAFQSSLHGTLSLPSTVQSIGLRAFDACSDLSGTLSIPSSVQFIGDNAFYQCDNILQLDMNESPASIPASCFEHCDRLVTVNLSPNTDSIQQNAFKNCKRLTNVNIGDGTVSIGENAFQNCPRLINVHFGDGVQSIGSNAFKDDGRLLYSGLPSALQTIGENAFQNCTEFGGDITIPAGVTAIKQFAFSGCNGISSLTMRPVNPPPIYATTFDSVDVNIPVYVPCGRVLHYYTTNYWENFPNLLEAEPYAVSVAANDEMMGAVEVTQTPTCENPRARITATAIPGYHFVQWSDGNLANPRIVELSSDSTFEAQFAINYISILVHSSDSIKGNVTGSGRYYYDSPVSLTATPNNNYHFLCWSDGNTSNPRYMAATHDSTFTAVFVSNVSTITIGNNNPDMGNVSGGGVYYYQNWVTFSASPYYGYHFTQWSDGNVENPRTIMVDRDTTFTATFALNLYAVSVNSVNSTMGYVEGTGNYTYQTTIGITATPNYGYHFTQWNDGNTNNPRTIVVSKDTMFTAQFAANEYQLTVSSNYPAMGSAYGAGTFNYSTQTTIAAAANYGYHFTQWSDGNTENPRLVTVTHNTDFEAQFAPNLYAITTNASNPVCGSASGGGSYNYLSSISIVATPNYGYRFTQWSDGNTDNPRSITVMSNGTYTAQFAINSYAITALPNNSSRGLVSGSGNYVYNSATTISATSYYGYHFTQWNDGNTENPRTVVITQDAQYTAQFDYNTYQLNTFSNDITIGNVTGGGSYDFNSQVAITANAAPHHHFVHWNDTVADNPRTIVLTRDTNITAIFSIDRHSVDVRTANLQMGSTLGSGEYDYNASVFITAVPNYGYHFESWADGSTQNPRRIVVQNDSIFTAVFGINQYAIITHSNDTLMGSVTPSASYNYNTMATIMAMPAAGHHFVAWNDGNTDNPRTFVVTCDSTFTAQFAIKTYMLTVHPNDTAMGSVSGGGIYQYREQAVLSATAREHYHFVQWHDGNTSNPRILLVSNDSNFVAQFVEDERYEISVISTDANAGTTTGSGTYYVGTQLYISAVPDEHHLFTRWTDGSVDNPRSITVLGNTTYIACFDPKDYEVSVFPNNETMGSVSGGGTFSYGTTTTINAYPRAGYHFERWSDGDVNASRTITVEGNTVYIAEFAEGVGIEENAANEEINVYPNPTKGSVTIHHGNVNGNILVYDVYGKLIKKQELESEQTEMNLSDCADGLYLLHIVSNGTLMKTMKVVKE